MATKLWGRREVAKTVHAASGSSYAGLEIDADHLMLCSSATVSPNSSAVIDGGTLKRE
jgi:hypothetical protein